MMEVLNKKPHPDRTERGLKKWGAGWVPRPGLYIRSLGVRFPCAPVIRISDFLEDCNEYFKKRKTRDDH